MNKKWLYDNYIVQNRSTQEIADEFGCNRNTIQCWLNKHGIKKETPLRRQRSRTEQYQQKDYLFEEHINKHKSIAEIARENNVSGDTITKYLKEFGIEYWRSQNKTKFTKQQEDDICKLYINNNLSTVQISEMYGCSDCTVNRIIKRNGYQTRTIQESQYAHNDKEIPKELNDKDLLNDLHWNQGLSCKDIAQMIGSDPGVVRRQMHRLGLKTKTNAESKIGLMMGEKHPNWKGGITELSVLLREYFNTNLAPVAAKRDNYTCQLCGKTHTVLHVHHIKPFNQIVNEIVDSHPELDVQKDKQILYDIITHNDEFLDINNLVTYCKDCHLFKIHHYKRKDN